jgi:hypothetical protein
MRTRLAFAAACVFAMAARTAIAADRPIVVELFTSQSCSSCPPADALLEELSRSRADVLPLDMHVTYWDHLGWKDRYSLEAATERQRQYGRSLGAGQVYTPQMVIDGRIDAVGSNRRAVLDAIGAAAAARKGGVPVAVTPAGDKLRIEAGQGQGEATLWLVGFDARHVTSVGAGENAGRTLTEVNVVRSLKPVAAWRGAALDFTVARPPGERAAVLLQAEDGRYLGAAALAAAAGS